jgi:hypothetical protein
MIMLVMYSKFLDMAPGLLSKVYPRGHEMAVSSKRRNTMGVPVEDRVVFDLLTCKYLLDNQSIAE